LNLFALLRPLLLLAAILIAPVPAFAGGLAFCDDLRGMPVNLAVDWQTEVKPILNTSMGGRCTGCHSGAQFPDMTDNGVDAIYKLVNTYAIPGAPLVSGLFDKVNCDPPALGQRMPLGGAPLSLQQQALIYDWIEQGARGEDPAQPIPRTFLFRDGMESLRWY